MVIGFNDLGEILKTVLETGEDEVIFSLAARSPDNDTAPDGSIFITLRGGGHEATGHAIKMEDAVLIARGKLRRMKEKKDEA